jgi:AcrR family transcriptional regulator
VAGALTKERIVAAALALLDDVGRDGLTLRALGDRLGVKAPALYWHVPSKAALLDEMATEVWRAIVAEVDALPPDTPWDQAMHAYAEAMRRHLLGHRDGARLFSGTYLTDDLLRGNEERLGRLRASGFSLTDGVRAYLLLMSFVVGCCIEEQSIAQARDEGDERYDLAYRARRIGTSAPAVVEAGAALFGTPDVTFAALVDIVVDAAGRMRAQR